MQKYTVIYLNGPIGSGKDTIGTALVKLLTESGFTAQTDQFKESLYDLASLIASIPRDLFVEHATDRILKESPFFMLPKNFIEGTPSYGTYFSPRDWLIHVSERVAKPLLGKGVFGIQTAKRVVPYFEANKGGVVVLTDSGFEEERHELDQAIVGNLGSSYRSFLIRLHRDGTSFTNDSRSYLANPDLLVDNHLPLEKIDYLAKNILVQLGVL